MYNSSAGTIDEIDTRRYTELYQPVVQNESKVIRVETKTNHMLFGVNAIEYYR